MGGVRKLVRAAALAVACLLVLAGAPTAYGATTLQVDAATGVDSPTCGTTTPCQTIQQAVDNASPGDVIQVAAGTYNESLSIGESLTLEGAQAGNAGSASRASESPASESVVTGDVTVEAAGVTLNGFSFSSSGTQVTLEGTTTGATVENNEFSGYSTALDVFAPATSITGNYFTTNPDFGASAVMVFNCDGTVVRNNTFYEAANDGLGDIYFHYCTGDPSSVITLSGNQVTHIGDTNGESFAVFLGVAGNVDITDNSVTNSPTSGSTIYFNGNPSIGAVDISGNTMPGTASAGVVILGSAGSGAFTITGNGLSSGVYGIYVGNGSLASGATVTARGNDLSGNSTGVRGDKGTAPVPQVDAEDNWWGCNAGPGQPGCSPSAGAVKADTWLVLGVSASPSSTSTIGSSTVTADLTRNSVGDDTSASGTIPDGTSIGFATDYGNLSASSAGTSGGKASVTLTSWRAGTAHVSATFDSETVSTAVIITLAAGSPTIASLSPPNGSAGTTVAITGSNLAGATGVSFGDTAAQSFRVVTDAEISAVVAAGTHTGLVFVTTPRGTATSARPFTVAAFQPMIEAVSPSQGRAGDTVTVRGLHLSGATAVSFNGTPATTFTVQSDSALTAVVPIGATTGRLSLTTPAGHATSVGVFTLLPTLATAPTITGFTPSSGIRGVRVVIRGTALTGATAVTFNGSRAAFTVQNDTTIVAVVPPGATTGHIAVATPAGVATSTGTFTAS